MTELSELRTVPGADGGSGGPRSTGTGARSWKPRTIMLTVLALVVVIAAVVIVVVAGGSSGSPSAQTVSIVSPWYTPRTTVGSTDDYHCMLVNPHITENSYVISSRFEPGSVEVHHAVLALVPPSLAGKALRENAQTDGKGWTCFGAPSLPGANLSQFLSTPFLSIWAPGHGTDALPRGTGVRLPAGSLVIEQVHYNLLAGDKPVQNSLALDTVPATTPLLPLNLNIALAPPDLPCPSGVTGPLCNRAASVANQGKRFGEQAVEIVGGIEGLCGHSASDPPDGDTASCISTIHKGGYIVRTQAHMHLLGVSFSMIVNPGTPQARTVLDVPHYNFDYQKAYNLAAPIRVKPGDKLQVNCTYNPRLAQELPALRKAPPHYVTWGDGSSDEMCIGLAWTSATLPNTHDSL
jgi:Copper type II ascorbate-dependent monooxygenase, C-terminal domain